MLNKIFLRQVLAGILTRIPFVKHYLLKKFYQSTGGTKSAEYCLLVWAKHLENLNKNGFDIIGKSVLELGPGDSLGVGVIAVLAGASRYHGVDTLDYNVIQNTKAVLNELVDMVESKKLIKDNPKVKPHFEGTEEILYSQLFKWRNDPNFKLEAENLMKELEDYFSEPLKVRRVNFLPLSEYLGERNADTFDFIFSQSVLEYIDHPKAAIDSMYLRLNENGWISHEVDMGCMRTAVNWDGHWAYPDWIWSIMKGKRPIFVNRNTIDDYLSFIQNGIWKKVGIFPFYRTSETPKKKLAKRFKNLSEETLRASSVYFIAQK